MEYQKVLKKQISAVLDDLNGKQFETVSDYLVNCYETGYIGTMYDIQNQGIPIIQPIQQDQVVQAVTHDTKLSKSLYQSLGYNVSELKKQIASELSRGISSAMSYIEIARNIQKKANTTLSKSMTIARTEGHRITQTATYNAQRVAKDTGADIVKQWDSTLDRRTRKSHQRVDGEIRELDETFSNGLMYPGDPSGSASEVINCRCALLQRARWALDEDELQTLKEKAKYFGLDMTKDFEAFKNKYLKATETTKNFTENTAKRIFDNKFTIAIDSSVLYNNFPVQEAYDRAIMSGELTPLASIELYVAVSTQIDKEIVGLITANGIEVKSKSDHFIVRTIGSVEQRRNGVAISDIIKALAKPDRIDPVQVRTNGKTQRFILKGVCAVTINPDAGNLIQVNPLR